MLVVGHLIGVTLGLLEWRKACAVRLRVSLCEVYVDGLLLNEDVRGGDVSVDKTGVGELDTLLELYGVGGLWRSEDVAEQGDPIALRLLFLVAAVFPLDGEVAGGGSSLNIC